MAKITLIGKPGCHLCDDAREAVTAIAAERGDSVEEINMLDDPELVSKYAELIPVILVNDKQHDYWRVDPVRLRAALDKADAAS